MTVSRSQETRSVNRARRLRRVSTDTERMMWRVLRDRQLGVKFRRQHPIGPYIVDFFCEDSCLVIEIDGGQHGPEVDKVRTEYLQSNGIHVMRFWNNEVRENMEGVVTTIQERLKGEGA